MSKRENGNALHNLVAREKWVFANEMDTNGHSVNFAVKHYPIPAITETTLCRERPDLLRRLNAWSHVSREEGALASEKLHPSY